MNALTQEQIELQLQGMAAPDGTIALSDLAGMAGALQLLTTRIARDLDGSAGPGRTSGLLDSIAQLRLGAIAEGSTRLVLEAGNDQALPVPLPLEIEIFDRFWLILDGLATNQRPGWVTPLIAEAASSVGTALASAKTVTFSGSSRGQVRPQVRVAPEQVSRTVWTMDPEQTTRAGVTVTGMLEMVDLRRLQFRIHDDVGNDIVLDEIENASAAALVGQRVSADGEATVDDNGRVTRVRSARVELVTLPTEWTRAGRDVGQATDWAELSAALAGPGPGFGGIDGVTSDDVEEFLTSLRA